MRAVEHPLAWDQVQELLHDLIVAMNQFDVRSARELLMHGVREYRPGDELVDSVGCRREREGRARSKATSIEARRGVARRDSGTTAGPTGRGRPRRGRCATGEREILGS